MFSDLRKDGAEEFLEQALTSHLGARRLLDLFGRHRLGRADADAVRADEVLELAVEVILRLRVAEYQHLHVQTNTCVCPVVNGEAFGLAVVQFCTRVAYQEVPPQIRG